MAPPTPPVPLKGHCSVIYDNTLYVYSPQAFQSIPLQEGGKWTQLAMGTSVTGATCVQGFPAGDGSKAALYIVGGSANSSTTGYSGLQRYSFSDQKWSDITPVVPVTKNRQKHAATYLNSSSSILIYAGSQDGDSLPSSQTFAISTIPPYTVRAFSSDAPPVVEPTLLPWNDSHAVMIGGDPQNKRIYTFSPNDGWQALNVNLTDGLKDRSRVQSTLVNGDDGSKVLEIFDTTTSPNTVTRTVLLNANGQPARQGEQVGNPSSSSASLSSTSPRPAKRRKRNLALSDWPLYNDTLAPTATRRGYSLAQDSKGLVVLSGGNDQDPLSVFDQRNNQWLNATTFFGGANSQQNSDFKPTSTTSPTTSSSTNPAASSSAAGGDVGRAAAERTQTLKILGATLGAIFGVAALLVGLLLLLRRIRRRKEAQRRQHPQGFREDQKNRLSFADQGASFMSEAGGSFGLTRDHQSSTPSRSANAITSGPPVPNRGPFYKDEITGGSLRFNQGKRPLVPVFRPEDPTGARIISSARGTERAPTGAVAARTEPRTDSGWSKYFSGNSATNLVNIPSGRLTYLSQSQSSESNYSDSRVQSSNPHVSAEVPPLSFGGQPLSHVNKGSPTLGHSASDTRGTGLALSEGMTAHLSRQDSSSSVSSLNEREDAFSSGISSSIQEETTWTPVGTHDFEQRPPSSIYTDNSHKRETCIPSFPFPAARERERDRASAVTRWPPETTVTPFPRRGDGVTVTDVEDYERRRRRDPGRLDVHEDMSWLNLGGASPNPS